MPLLQFFLVKQQELHGRRAVDSLSLGKLIKQLFTTISSLILISSLAQAEEVILRHSFAGNLSFELTGNTLRDANDTCRQINGGGSSGTINLPVNASIEAAYLYWSGSGDIDDSVTLNGQTVNADLSYTEVFNSRNYFSSKAEVTSLVSDNSSTSYRVSDLSFDGSASYCNTAGAYGGWALAIIYQHNNEPLRVINVFDGFKNFWGNQFSLIPDNFVIAQNPASKGGKHAHITWEGDEGNSQSRNGFVESLKFEGTNLTDTNNPSNNQFNGYSNVTGTTSGVDIDEYNIGNLLIPGETSVSTTYSSGQDAVFLTAELISVPNEPVADLTINQSGPTEIIRGQVNMFNFNIINNGPSTAPQNSEFSFTIPQGFNYISSLNPGWSCSQNNNDLSCLYLNSIPSATSGSALSLSFTIDSNAESNDSINLTASIKGLLFDNILSNNTDLASYIIKGPELSTSVKRVVDLNGGNVNSGDTLRYSITIKETAGFPIDKVTLVDSLAAEFSHFQIISLPEGASDNSLIAPAGDFNSGLIDINNISLLANSSKTLIYDATLSSSLAAGTEINNSATLSASAIEDLVINAPAVFASQAMNPSEGNKILYLHSDSSVSRPDQIMRRNRPTIMDNRNIGRNNRDAIWTLAPEFQSPFEFNGPNINLNLCLQSNQNSSLTHTMRLQLLHNSTVIADSNNISLTIPSKNSAIEQFQYTIPLLQSPMINTGDTLKLRIVNINGEGGIRVYSLDGSDFCYISIPAKTVINVDSIDIVDESSNSSISQSYSGTDIRIETIISDPFGSFDITAAELTAIDAEDNEIFSNTPMNIINDSGSATKTYSFNYTIPPNAQTGYWKFTVKAKEGEENTIDHSSDFMLLVNRPLPNINVDKSIAIHSDPIHGINNPGNYSKALPGAILTYTIETTNTGEGVAENNSIWINDSVPENTAMSVTDFKGAAGVGPIHIEPVLSPSGLSYSYISLSSNSDDLEFSNNNGIDYNYAPVADANGTDKNITHFRINPKGTFQAPAAGESATQFTIKFQVQLQ